MGFSWIWTKRVEADGTVRSPQQDDPANTNRTCVDFRGLWEEGYVPFISIVIPVRNESATLPSLLQELILQHYPKDRYEIVVADGVSNDGTAVLVKELALTASVQVRLVTNWAIRSGGGRNVGVQTAKGDIIVFIDGHCSIPSRLLLQNTASLMAMTGAQCLSRPQPLVAATSSRFGAVVANVRASWLGHGRDSLIYDMERSGFVDPTTSGASYLRAVFDRVGYYDESFDACEDCDFNLRVKKAGMLAYTDPSLAINYVPRGSIRGLWKQMVRYGRGRIRLMRKHPDYLSLSQLAPAVLVACAVGLIPAFYLPAVVGWIPATVVASFTMLILLCSLQLSLRHGVDHLWRGPLAFVCIYGGLGVGMLLEVASRKQRRVPSLA